MNDEDHAFINEIARGLDSSIRQLLLEEQKLMTKLGQERVAELLEFWQKQLPAAEEEAFRLTLDYNDKKLTWVWLRLKRARQTRTCAGQVLMKNHPNRTD